MCFLQENVSSIFTSTCIFIFRCENRGERRERGGFRTEDGRLQPGVVKLSQTYSESIVMDPGLDTGSKKSREIHIEIDQIKKKQKKFSQEIYFKHT